MAAMAPAQAKGTAAGTTLVAASNVTFFDTVLKAVKTPDTVVTVDPKPGITVSLSKSSDIVVGAKAYPCVVTNTANFTDSLIVSVSTSKNAYAILVKDTNGDGIWQPSESQTVNVVLNVAPDQAIPCLLVVQSNVGTPAGDPGTATITAMSAKDRSVTSSATFNATFGARTAPVVVYDLPQPASTSPIVSQGTAIVGTEVGCVYSVNVTGANAGTLAWKYPEQGNAGGPIHDRVATDGAGYYFTAADGLVCRLSTDGKLVWQTKLAGEGAGSSAMPLVGATDVTVACGDGCIRRLDKQTGALLSVSSSVGAGALGTPSMPQTADMWVGGSDGRLYNINAEAGCAVMSSLPISGQPVSATPFVDVRSGLVLTATTEGNVYALGSHSNAVKWGPVALGSSVKGSPWVDSADGIAYFGGVDGTIYALHVADGSAVAGYPVHVNDGGGFEGSPIVDPIATGQKVLFAASTAGRLYGFRPSDPAHMVLFDANDPSIQFVGTPALSGAGPDGVLVVVGTNGRIYGFRAGDAVAP
jgi:hypothetical protein